VETQNKTAVNETIFRAATDQSVERKRRIKSSFLFQGRREVMIVHEEEEYILRITRNGKLILTK
jgi:hemin uptake protein HemP